MMQPTLIDPRGRPLSRGKRRVEKPSAEMLGLGLGLGLGRCRAPSGSAPFVPTGIAGLLAWYRPDAAAVTLNGGDVSALLDQSGTGDANKHASQADAGQQPLYVASNAAYNNQPTITFAATDRLTTGTWTVPPTQALTIYTVGARGATGALRFFFDGLASPDRINLVGDDPAALVIAAGGAGVTDTLAASTPAAICCVIDGASSATYVNVIGTASATGDAGTAVVAGLTLGNRFALDFGLSADLADLIVYDGAHDATTRGQLMGDYIATRYALPVAP